VSEQTTEPQTLEEWKEAYFRILHLKNDFQNRFNSQRQNIDKAVHLINNVLPKPSEGQTDEDVMTKNQIKLSKWAFSSRDKSNDEELKEQS